MNDLPQLLGLMRELTSALETVYASGEQLSDELQLEVARTLEILFNRIQQLREQPQEAPTSPAPTTQDITQAMPSSNVEGFAYDDENDRLLVRFLGKYPDRNGPIYAYDGVPRVIFDLFRSGSVPARTDGHNRWGRWWKGKVPSIGASLYTLIKTQAYPYTRLS